MILHTAFTLRFCFLSFVSNPLLEAFWRSLLTKSFYLFFSLFGQIPWGFHYSVYFVMLSDLSKYSSQLYLLSRRTSMCLFLQTVFLSFYLILFHINMFHCFSSDCLFFWEFFFLIRLIFSRPPKLTVRFRMHYSMDGSYKTFIVLSWIFRITILFLKSFVKQNSTHFMCSYAYL